MINSCYKKALEILQQHKNILDALANALIEKEVLEGEEFEVLVNSFINESGKTTG